MEVYLKPVVSTFCPKCKRHLMLITSEIGDNYEIHCPYCGEKIMLCMVCTTNDPKRKCDFDTVARTCYRCKSQESESSARALAYDKFESQLKADRDKFLAQYSTAETAIKNAYAIARYQGLYTDVLSFLEKYDENDMPFFNRLCDFEDKYGNLVKCLCNYDDGYPAAMWITSGRSRRLISEFLADAATLNGLS